MDVLITVAENCHTPNGEVALEHSATQFSILKYLRNKNLLPYNIQLVHELQEDEESRVLCRYDGSI